MRADGSGQHALTSGPEIDARPQFAPNGHYVVFERRAAAGGPRDLYTVDIAAEGLHALTATADDEHQATFSPDGRTIAFVTGVALGNGVADDIYSVRPSGAGLARLTRTGKVDEFSPRYFAGGIAFSRGQSGSGPGAYADVYTMRRNGTRVRPSVRGVGSAAIEDVSPNGHTLLFRRDQGLWVKRLGGGAARKLTEVADNSSTNAVFSSDGAPRRRIRRHRRCRDASRRSASRTAAAPSWPKASASKAARSRRRSARSSPGSRCASQPPKPPGGYNRRVAGGGEPAIGSTLAGYRLDALIARGGMGVVYRATHLALDRQVALKVIARHLEQRRAFPRAVPARVAPRRQPRSPQRRPRLRRARGGRRADRRDASGRRRRPEETDRGRAAGARGGDRPPGPGRRGPRLRPRCRDRPS